MARNIELWSSVRKNTINKVEWLMSISFTNDHLFTGIPQIYQIFYTLI